jgi:hypothetical protein
MGLFHFPTKGNFVCGVVLKIKNRKIVLKDGKTKEIYGSVAKN